TGWRWALALGMVPAAYSLVVRWGMPESVRFLELKGRADEAEAVVRGFESSPAISRRQGRAAAAEADGRVRADEVGTIPAPDQVEASGGIWSASLRRRTAGLWAVWFCINLSYYGAF